ncbi:MAG: glycosyl transferase [Gammaproteobacteria bacterium]|nr:MAG: glycosyl transferase [Gammaproteobacteria bacterium]
MSGISIVIPAKNEATSLIVLLPELKALYPEAEIIVVNDGASDNTSEICSNNAVIEIVHRYSKGNGASIKSGARAATGDVIVFMDGDGQHQPKEIKKLLEKMEEGYDMVVGARRSESQASVARLAANGAYNRLATWMTGHKVEDLTSGFRVVKASLFKQYLYLLPNGFSYPTTITMAFFRAGLGVAYVNVEVEKRVGDSHISIVKDGIRFFLIIFKIGTLYSPLKLFFPVSAFLFFIGLSYYLFTFITASRFTNMSALLFSTSILVFLMGLVSEQITTLSYSSRGGPTKMDVDDIRVIRKR